MLAIMDGDRNRFRARKCAGVHRLRLPHIGHLILRTLILLLVITNNFEAIQQMSNQRSQNKTRQKENNSSIFNFVMKNLTSRRPPGPWWLRSSPQETKTAIM